MCLQSLQWASSGPEAEVLRSPVPVDLDQVPKRSRIPGLEATVGGDRQERPWRHAEKPGLLLHQDHGCPSSLVRYAQQIGCFATLTVTTRSSANVVVASISRCSRLLRRACIPTAGELKAGELLGNKYEVQEVLGRGANAVTYKVCCRLWVTAVLFVEGGR